MIYKAPTSIKNHGQ